MGNFDFSEEMKRAFEHQVKLMAEIYKDALKEALELDEAWNKRDKEVKELEKLYALE